MFLCWLLVDSGCFALAPRVAFVLAQWVSLLWLCACFSCFMLASRDGSVLTP